LPVNVDYRRFVDELRLSGVDVFDPAPEHIVPGEPRFLRQDTHWTPEWMETVARDLADHLSARVPALRAAMRTWRVEETQVSRVGDIVNMLRLPAGQRLYLPQTVTVHRVLDPGNGRAWQATEEAEILLLGDSFSNIYCEPEMGWGEGAGLPAQLARFLGHDVDVIARNGSGAAATRRELARRPDPLKAKTVVVWEFAARELMTANWEVVPLPARRSVIQGQGASHAPTERLAALVLEGTIVAASRVRQPLTVPYKDCLTYLRLRVDRVVEGRYEDDHIIAVFWGMKDNVRLPAADYSTGKRLRLYVLPMRKAPVNLRTVRSADDLDDYEHSPYYVLEERAL
jgi:alginate O-acetyltransferase complex protein AlgJ